MKILKRHPNRQGISQIFTICRCHDALCRKPEKKKHKKKQKNSTKKLLELIEEVSKFAQYKINVQKSVAFLYIYNETAEREIKESIPFTTASKTISYLGTNLNSGKRSVS